MKTLEHADDLAAVNKVLAVGRLRLTERRRAMIAEWVRNPHYSPLRPHIDDRLGAKWKTPPKAGLMHIHLTEWERVNEPEPRRRPVEDPKPDIKMITLTTTAALGLVEAFVVAHNFRPPAPKKKDVIFREWLKHDLVEYHPYWGNEWLNLTWFGCKVLGHILAILEHEHAGRKA